MTAKKGVPRAEASRSASQPVCASCGHAYVKRKGQLCEVCQRKKKTRQHTLGQQKLAGGR